MEVIFQQDDLKVEQELPDILVLTNSGDSRLHYVQVREEWRKNYDKQLEIVANVFAQFTTEKTKVWKNQLKNVRQVLAETPNPDTFVNHFILKNSSRRIRLAIATNYSKETITHLVEVTD